MLLINVIASGLSGNCYVLDNGNSRLMIECGLPWNRIKRLLDFKTSDIEGVLVTHEHLDHSRAVNDMLKYGFDIHTSKGTAEAIHATGHRLHHIESTQQFNILEWTILPFDTVHDAAEPLGFLISSGADKLLFLTDSAYCNYRFQGINYLMLECNFSVEILERNVDSGLIDGSRRRRLLESHFSLDRVKDFIEENDTSKLQEIYLMHLSDQNSDEQQSKKEIQQLTGVPVYVC